MRKDIKEVIELPSGISASLNERILIFSGSGRELKRKLSLGKINLEISSDKIILSAKKASKREIKTLQTTRAHILNMIKGIQEDFIYRLEICNVHFPMNVKVEGSKVVIKSFLGEKQERVANILPETKVEIKGNEIIVSSPNIELAGQTSANLEKATRLVGRDRRIFQDGIFITDKHGRKI